MDGTPITVTGSISVVVLITLAFFLGGVYRQLGSIEKEVGKFRKNQHKLYSLFTAWALKNDIEISKLDDDSDE